MIRLSMPHRTSKSYLNLRHMTARAWKSHVFSGRQQASDTSFMIKVISQQRWGGLWLILSVFRLKSRIYANKFGSCINPRGKTFW